MPLGLLLSQFVHNHKAVETVSRGTPPFHPLRRTLLQITQQQHRQSSKDLSRDLRWCGRVDLQVVPVSAAPEQYCTTADKVMLNRCSDASKSILISPTCALVSMLTSQGLSVYRSYVLPCYLVKGGLMQVTVQIQVYLRSSPKLLQVQWYCQLRANLGQRQSGTA